MFYKRCRVTLYPGSRPSGLPQFGSSSEENHYKEVMASFSHYDSFQELGKLGIFIARLTEEEQAVLVLNPYVKSVNEDKPLRTSKLTQSDAGWALSCLADRQAEDKYTYSSTGKGVDIYIIDGGIQCDLPEFSGRASRIYDNRPTEPDLICPHGTQTASTAAGVTYGAAKDATIYDVRVQAADCTIYSIEGVDAVLAHYTPGNDAICSMSFGGHDFNQDLSDGVAAMISEGIFCVAAAGNEAWGGSNYPSDHCFSVGASQEDGGAAYFTNFGVNVNCFAPGHNLDAIGLSGEQVLVSGTSFACPFTAAVAAMLMESALEPYTQATMEARILEWCKVDGVDHSLADTTKLLVQSQIPITYIGAEGASDTAFTDKLSGLDFRKSFSFDFSFLETNDDVTAIADSLFKTTRYADVGVTLGLTGLFQSTLGGVEYTATKVATGEHPRVGSGGPVTPGGALVINTVVPDTSPEELMSLSMSLTPSGGSASFKTTHDTQHETKELIVLQGMECVIERIGPEFGPGKQYAVDCKITPLLAQEYISLNRYYAKDGAFFSVSALISEAATLAGVTVSILVPDVKVKEFNQAGKFEEVLSSLAGLLYGVVIQQNGAWFIGRANTVLGDFTIENPELMTYNRSKQGDVVNTVMGFISRLTQIYVNIDTLIREIADLKKELEKIKAIEEAEEAAGKVTEGATARAQFLGNIQIKFGQVNNTQWQGIDNAHDVQARQWEFWTPEEGKSVNPTDPGRRYYHVVEIRDSEGRPTGEMKGLLKLASCKIRVEIQEPSNFGGIYYAKGRSLNFSGCFSEYTWTTPTSETEQFLNDETHQYEEKTYLVFSPTPSRFDPYAEEDEQFYYLDLELRYMPALVIPWKFAGTLVYDNWPVFSGGTCLGRVDRSGGFVDPSGAGVTTLDDIADLPGGGTVTDKACILNSNGELCGTASQGGVFTSITGVHAGILNSTTGDIRSTSTTWGSILGWLAGTMPLSLTFPGLDDTSEIQESDSIYFTNEMPGAHGIDFSGYDPEHPELWDPTIDPAEEIRNTRISELTILIKEKENELATLYIEAAFLEEELRSYGAEILIPLIKATAEATTDLNIEFERQQKLGITNTEIVCRKQAVIAAAQSAVYTALSGLHLESLNVSCSFIYNNVLPLPQNLLTVAGEIQDEDLIITSVNLQLGSKSVAIQAVRRIA